MREKLVQLVEREADFLLAQKAGLSPDDLAKLEALCKCARALKVDAEGAPSPPEDADVEEDLDKLDKLRAGGY